MNKKEIANELRDLERRIVDDLEYSSAYKEVDKFNDWVDEMMMKGKKFQFLNTSSNVRYMRYSNLRALVLNLYHMQHSSEYEYQKNKPDIK